MAKKRKTELTPNMQDCLKRFAGPEFVLPFRNDVRTCDALESRGLMEGKLVLAAERCVPGGVDRTYKRAYRAIQST